MVRKVFVVFALLLINFCISAHEFWVKPSSFFFQKGESAKLTAMVGENYEGEAWGGGDRRFVSFTHFTQNGKEDLLHLIEQSDELVKLPEISLRSDGTQVLSFTTNSSSIELPPNEFLAYLKEDGLDNAILYREQKGEVEKPGREWYRRCTKILLQVGNQATGTFAEPTGMVLDILPSANPYSMTKPGKVGFQIVYEQKPLANALVRCWQKSSGKTSVAFLRSDSNGTVEFALDKQGDYMISVVNMVRLEAGMEADWQSTWGSLVFGVKFDN